MVVIKDWEERREEKLRSESKKKKGKKICMCIFIFKIIYIYIYNRFSRLENKPLE